MDQHQEQAEVNAAKADPACFGVLYERHFTVIYRFIHRRAQDRHLAADLTQQTFLKAMLALHRYEPRGHPFRAFLFRIALNELRMHWRKRKELVRDLSYGEVHGLTVEMGLPGGDDDMRRLALALGRLEPAKAQLIELRFMDGLSFADVGAVLGIAEDAAKMRTHRVLATLRTYLVRQA